MMKVSFASIMVVFKNAGHAERPRYKITLDFDLWHSGYSVGRVPSCFHLFFPWKFCIRISFIY